jgi:site-specific recombinase XerD
MAIRKRTGKRGVTWQIDYTDPTGKRVRQSFKFKKDAVAEHSKRVSLMAEGRYLDVKKPCETTLGQMIEIYTAKYGNQASFEISKRAWLENFKEYFGENTLLDRITYNKICDYQFHLENKPVRMGGIRKKSSVNRELSCLRHMLKMAVARDKLASNPFANKESLHYREPKAQVRFLEKDEIDRLLETTMPEHYRDAIIGILLTGMRRQEALNLKWQHVRDGVIYLAKTKADKPRWLPMSDELRDHLRAVRRKNELKSEYVFCDPKGRKINRDTFSGAVESAMRRANIDAARPVHTLRHTFASHFIMNGGDLPSLRKILGHQTMDMTNKYAHLAPNYLKKSIQAINGLTTKKCDENVTCMVSKPSIASM